jgi:hypothetical protein
MQGSSWPVEGGRASDAAARTTESKGQENK